MVHAAKSKGMRRWRLPLRLGTGAPPWSLASSAISIHDMAKNIWHAEGSAPPEPDGRMAIIVRRRGLERAIGVLLASPSVIEYCFVPVARRMPKHCAFHRAGLVAGNERRASNVER